jgi:hypothetical protein
MNRFARLILASSCSLALAVPALAGVVINSPADGSYLSSSFRLDAYSNSCGSQPVGAMGYSFDDSSNTSFVDAQSIYQFISSATGSHVLHVKSWGNNGSSCVTDIDIHVTSGSTSTSSASVSIPSGSSSVSNIQVLNWSKTHDSGGSGSASGYTDLVTSPSLYGTTRRTVTTFSDNGDERYSVTFSDNTSAKNFVWDGWVYFTSSSSMLANLELDVNQTLPSGATMFAGVQCDGWTGHWSYTSNTGSVSSPRMKWIQANSTSCNPQKWSQYKWHHVQFSLSRDNSGYVTYHSVWLDGVEIPLNATVPTAANDGWGPAINTQFQIDGYGSSGHVTAYLDSLKISMW